MKKQILSLLAILFSCLIALQTSAQNNTTAKSQITTTNAKTITVAENTVVPASNIYYVYDANGKLVVTYKGGEKVQLSHLKKAKKETKDPPKINCVQINCPSTFGANATCWKCQ